MWMLTGCGPNVGDGTDTTAAGSSTGDVAASTSDAMSGPGDATTTAVSSSTSGGAADETGSSSGGEPGLDPACAGSDGANATFELAFVDEAAWMDVEGFDDVDLYELSIPCRVTDVAIDSGAGSVVSSLTCGAVDSPRLATLTHALAPEGNPVWGPEDEVLLSAVRYSALFGPPSMARAVALSSVDGTRVLFAALDGTDLVLGTQVQAPITMEVETDHCLEDGAPEDTLRYVLVTAVTSTEELTLVGRQRGSVSSDDETLLVGDIQQARTRLPPIGKVLYLELLVMYQRVVP